VVDQHAAHERILYETLEQRYRSEPPAELPHAELLPLTPEDEATYRERQGELAEKGLMLEPFGGGRWRVRQVPAFLLGHPDLISGVVTDALGRGSADEAWRAVLGRLACLPALKAGHELAHAEAQILLDALAACETPWACPHGRPTALVLSELELARRFGRRGVRATAPKVEEIEVSQ
jgi:DNA mismatch repair protein MutL